MTSLSSFVIALLLSCQLTFTAAVESFSVAANEVHQVFSHDQSIGHHHHDAFAAQADYEATDPAHQHVSDNSQSSALLPHIECFLSTITAEVLITSHPKELPSIFLDTLLRPPRASV